MNTPEWLKPGIYGAVKRALNAKGPKMTDNRPLPPKSRRGQVSFMNWPPQRGGVQVRERNGIWKVQVDGKFHGDYHQKEHALAAAALHKLT